MACEGKSTDHVHATGDAIMRKLISYTFKLHFALGYVLCLKYSLLLEQCRIIRVCCPDLPH